MNIDNIETLATERLSSLKEEDHLKKDIEYTLCMIKESKYFLNRIEGLPDRELLLLLISFFLKREIVFNKNLLASLLEK